MCNLQDNQLRNVVGFGTGTAGDHFYLWLASLTALSNSHRTDSDWTPFFNGWRLEREKMALNDFPRGGKHTSSVSSSAHPTQIAYRPVQPIAALDLAADITSHTPVLPPYCS